MSDASERSPLLSNHRAERDETQQVIESTPLLSTAATTLRYDGQTDGDASHDADPTSMTGRSSGPVSSKASKSKRIRWPSVIAVIVLSLFAVAVVVLGFVVPSAVEEYAKQAAVLEPTDLSLVSITAEGVRVRIQANFRLDAQRVPDGRVRSIGKTVGWLIGEIKTGPTRINVYLPQKNDMLLGTAAVPPLSVSITAGQNNAIDIVADLIPGEAESIRTIANEWLQGRLKTVQLRGQADVQLTAGIIPLGTHSIVESMMFEGSKLPHMPKYNITSLNVRDDPLPGHEGKTIAVEVSILTFNEYPISLDVPELAFEVLVPGCTAAAPSILVAAATTNAIAVRAHSDVIVDVRGSLVQLPDSLTRPCPDSDSSPLDMLFEKYLGGKPATVFVRGQKQPVAEVPGWIIELLSSITVPVALPGRPLDNLLREFSLSDVSFDMPDPAADPEDPRSKPRVSGTIVATAELPAELDLTLNVTGVRANSDVFYRGRKLGELKLKKWQKATSTQLPKKTGQHAALLKIQARINNAPVDVTNPNVLTDIIQSILFGKDVILGIKALVDAKVQTVLGDLMIKAIPAEGKFPIKPPEGGFLHSAVPEVSIMKVTNTTSTTLSFDALVNVTNPTLYSAHIPFISVHIESNGTTIGEVHAKKLNIRQGRNTNLVVSATWNPEMGGKEGLQRGRDVISQYLSGFNTSFIVRTHRGTIPTLPLLGEALAQLNITLPAPRFACSDGAGSDKNNPEGPCFIRDATFHLLSSTATFTLVSPLRDTTIFIDNVDATALYNHSEPLGRIRYYLPFAAPPGASTTPKLPVEWSFDSIGYGKLRDALGGRMKVDAKADVGVRIGQWTERVWYIGKGIGASVRL